MEIVRNHFKKLHVSLSLLQNRDTPSLEIDQLSLIIGLLAATTRWGFLGHSLCIR